MAGQVEGGRPSRHANENWLELLRDGLTFDLLGLDPGPPVDSVSARFRFGSISANVEDATEAVGLFPGPHLVKGAHTVPVLRTLIGIAADLIRTYGAVRAVLWTPSQCILAPDLFVQLASEWQDGGPFPAPGLVGFNFEPDGALVTHGLAFLVGRELRIETGFAGNRIEVSRLGSRIIDTLVGHAPVEFPQRYSWPGLPEVVLSDDPEAKLVRAQPS